jgi:hypothetical protein
MQHRQTTFFITDLLGCKIVTTEGKNIGRVVDMHLSPGPDFQITDLVYSHSAFLYKLHILRTLATRFGMHIEQGTIPWAAVDQYERAILTVRL